jgi:hypothetical protein
VYVQLARTVRDRIARAGLLALIGAVATGCSSTGASPDAARPGDGGDGLDRALDAAADSANEGPVLDGPLETSSSGDGPSATDEGSLPDGAADGPGEDGSDDAGGTDALGDDAGSCPAGCPTAVAPGHLQLWFQGDVGADCVPVDLQFRAVRWRDLSGHHRDAVAPLGRRGPLCGPSAGMIQDRTVMSFPRTDRADGEEYLEVSLEGLVDKSFTIAVVERRMPADFNSWMMGSSLPEPSAVACDGVNPNRNQGLAIGYPYPLKLEATVWGPGCDVQVDVPLMGARPNITVVTYSAGTGLTLFADGKQLGQLPSEGLKRTLQGLIGRAYPFTIDPPTDTRYHGDIAEVVAYDVALSTDQRGALESYFKQSWAVEP